MSDTSQKMAIIVDSSSILHRNFHAMRPITGSMDDYAMDVGAINGYMRYVAKQMYGPYSKLKFDILVHALDSDGSDYRRGLLPSYKGNRSPKHPALIAQESMMGRALTALGEHVIQQRGVEADDLIASMTRQLVAEGYLVCIITGDKDLMQLVKDGEVVVARYEKSGGSDFNSHVFYEEEDVFKHPKLGVYPSQVAAFLAMCGDTADNIKGVNGIGQKKAAALLQEYGSLESLLTRADEIKGKLGENFREAKADGTLDLCYKLTCPVYDMDVKLEPFLQKPILNEADALRWHTALRLGEDGPLPLRLSDFNKAPGYVPKSDKKPEPQVAPTPVKTPAPAAKAPAAAPAPAPVAAQPAPARAPDPFLDGSDPFGEGLDEIAANVNQPFVAPTPNTAADAAGSVVKAAASAAETPSGDVPAPARRFQRRPG